MRAMKDMYMRDLKNFLQASKAWWFQEENRLLLPPFLTLSPSPGNDMSCPGSISVERGQGWRKLTRPKPRHAQATRSPAQAVVRVWRSRHHNRRQAGGRQAEGRRRACGEGSE